VRKNQQEMVLAKPLEDGSVAIGLFNLSEKPLTISVNWNDVGASGTLIVRDAWRQRNIGSFTGSFKSVIGPHDVALVRLVKP
jgi:alpha-galactosidase